VLELRRKKTTNFLFKFRGRS